MSKLYLVTVYTGCSNGWLNTITIIYYYYYKQLFLSKSILLAIRQNRNTDTDN